MSGETEREVSGWTVDTLHESLGRRIEDMRAMLQERYQTQTKAVDAAFLAQQTAMQTALSAAEKAVETALLSAEKAVTKAELAADKRFEAGNEFRAQLADQAATLIGRDEAEARFASLAEKLAEVIERASEVDRRLSSRLDLTQGKDKGIERRTQGLTSQAQLILATLAVIFTVLVATGVFS